MTSSCNQPSFLTTYYQFIFVTHIVGLKAELRQIKNTLLDISHSTPGYQTVKVSLALHMELSMPAQYEGIERTDLFS